MDQSTSVEIREIMDRAVEDVFCANNVKVVQPDTSIHEAIVGMRQGNFGSIVVADNDKVTGIFTERDFVRKVVCQDEENDLKKTPVSKFMTPNPVTVTEKQTVGEVLLKMQTGNFRHIIVVNSENVAVQMVSVKDILSYLVESLISQIIEDYRKVG